MSNEVRHCGICGGTIAKDAGEMSGNTPVHTYCYAAQQTIKKKQEAKKKEGN